MRFFEELGVPLKTERGRRVFPQSDNAHDIADALARFAMGNGAALVQEPAVRVLVGKRRWSRGWRPPGGSTAPRR